LCVLVAAMAGRAQTNGTVGIADRLVTVFTTQSTTLSSGGIWQCNGSLTPIQCGVLPELGGGNACSTLSYQTTGFTGTITLEWSPLPAPNYTPIILTQASYSSGNFDTANHVLQLGGYFPNLRSTITPSAGNASAWFTSAASPCSFVAPGLGSNGAASPILCDHNTSVTIANLVTSSLNAIGPFNSGDKLIICGATISFQTAPSTGTVAFQWASSAANCATSATGASWAVDTLSTMTLPITVPVQIWPISGNPYPCFNNSSGAAALVSVFFASVHGL